MSGGRSVFAQGIEQALAGAPHVVADEQAPLRALLRPDLMERVVIAKLLRETVGRALELHSFREGAGMLLLDCHGGSEGARAASSLLPVIQEHLRGTNLVHLSCATKGRGVARLIERMLRALVPGLPATIDVLSTPAAVEEVCDRLERLEPQADMTVLLAPLGSAGLSWSFDGFGLGELVASAHASVLTYLDPESLVAALPVLEKDVESGRGFDRLRIDLYVDDDDGSRLLGSTEVGPGGEASQRLWVLIDNARRHRYEARLVPLLSGQPCAPPLHCPCRTLLEQRLRRFGAGVRIVPCGGLFAVVAAGRGTLA